MRNMTDHVSLLNNNESVQYNSIYEVAELNGSNDSSMNNPENRILR